jgi:hypothetical protein
MDMDSARVTNDLPTISRKIALMGSLVSRLIAFCLLYFAPALAYEQSPPAPDLAAVAGEPLTAESLDPKHEKDHDQDRDSDRTRAHFSRR